MKFEKGHYLAFVLSDNARSMLLLSFRPKFSKVYVHHVTVEFRLTQEKLDKILQELGDPKKVVLTGFSRSDHLELATVTLNGKTKRPDGGTYHITYSLDPPKKPVDSNQLLLATGGEAMYPMSGGVNIEGELKLVRM